MRKDSSPHSYNLANMEHSQNAYLPRSSVLKWSRSFHGKGTFCDIYLERHASDGPFPELPLASFSKRVLVHILILSYEWKLLFICMRMKINFLMKRWAPGLALKKRPKVIWENGLLVGFVICNKSHVLFQMIKDMKQQFSSLLRDIGFLDSSDPKATSANHNSGANFSSPSFWLFAVISVSSLLTTTTFVSFSENLKLVKAILCAGLYPNVAKIEHHRTFKRFVHI